MMAPTKVKSTQKVPAKPQEPVKPPLERTDTPSDSLDRYEALQKDETEQKLEKLIFGDEPGFLDSLRSHGAGKEVLRREASDELEEEEEDGDNLEGVADEDVCAVTLLRIGNSVADLRRSSSSLILAEAYSQIASQHQSH